MKSIPYHIPAIILSLFLGACSPGGSDASPPAPPPNQSDVTAPVISLTGKAEMIAEEGGGFDDPGATATDDRDGSVTVTVRGAVDTSTIGTYILNYEAVDAAGNRSAAKRQVDVVGPVLFEFYTNKADRFKFPESLRKALDTYIYASQDVIDNDYESARQKLDVLFAEQPFGREIWTDGAFEQDTDVGFPIAYYALRMLDQITAIGQQETKETLIMTAIVTPCATVRRPYQPNLAAETVETVIKPQIVENNYLLLYEITEIFRIWFKAITRGSELKLQIYEMEECTTVDFSFDANRIFSYADIDQILSSVPQSVVDETDLWWTVYPTGEPDDVTGYRQTFVTGGMGTDRLRNGVIISDDWLFLNKPNDRGFGPYVKVEQLTYLPGWFLHEYMHHIYRTFPEYALEASSHQWFDRTIWPTDFVGRYEPDYYMESLEKRIYDAVPSLALRANGTRPVDVSRYDLSDLVGQYERKLRFTSPADRVEITQQGENLIWTNEDGESWTLSKKNGGLVLDYFGVEQPVDVVLTSRTDATTPIARLVYGGGFYYRMP